MVADRSRFLGRFRIPGIQDRVLRNFAEGNQQLITHDD
jgi:hypothetical protein